MALFCLQFNTALMENSEIPTLSVLKRTCHMVIKVKGYANMKTYTAHLPSEGKLEVPEGATVDAVFKKLKVPPESKKIIIVNGRHKTGDYVLQIGDKLTFFPPLEGG